MRTFFVDSGEFSRLVRDFVAGVLIAGILLPLTGCASVPPYERGRLAHPTMAVDDPTRAAEEHVRGVHEGATGGGFAAGGGCGCN
jgi:hypothetical protein